MKAKYISLIVILFIPVIISAQVVNIEGGVNVVAQGNISLVIDQGGVKNEGIFIPGNSTVYFDGGPATAISGTQPITFYNATFRGTGNKLNSGNASVINTLAVEGTTVLDADGATNDKPFTILSSDSITGRVDILTTGNIIGNITVERFINTGNGVGEHAKSWQFLATPTNGQTYFQAWQESGLTPAGYGTWISGTGIGFDATTVLPSIKYYNATSVNWTAVTNTGNPLQNSLGYMLFVRGDRTVTTFNGAPNNTNMRSKGVLFTALNPPSSVAVAANQFQTFGNPYASRIEFNKVYLASTGINDVFYAWDPKLNGTYNFGGYQTISGVAGYIPTAGNGTDYYPAGVPSPNIESGQAVFVQGNVTGGNVNFNENCKVSGSRLVNRGNENFPQGRRFLFTTLFSNTGKIADGNIVAFENGLGNEFNDLDAVKIMNAGENLGISRNSNLLSVEAREEVISSDTIFYHLQNLRQQSYQFRFSPVNMQSGLTAFLIDRFNNTNTPISLTDSSFIDFTIGAGISSQAADRFILVFRQSIVVPVMFVNISANRNRDQSNQVNWKVDNEINLREYVIERSMNGRNFNDIGNTLLIENNGGTATYEYKDERPIIGVNFYRIRAISRNGGIQYSNIVKVVSVNESISIEVNPNPVQDNTINILFRNQVKGNYTLQLINVIGQVIFNSNVFIDKTEFLHTIRPGKVLAKGTYQLSLIKEEGSNIITKVIVE